MREGGIRDWISERVGNREEGVTATNGPDNTGHQVGSFDYNPEALQSRSDIPLELGISAETFVKRLVEQEGGQIRQAEFTRHTAFSPSTICRLLQELEAEGVIRRVRVGQEKIVILPS